MTPEDAEGADVGADAAMAEAPPPDMARNGMTNDMAPANAPAPAPAGAPEANAVADAPARPAAEPRETLRTRPRVDPPPPQPAAMAAAPAAAAPATAASTEPAKPAGRPEPTPPVDAVEARLRETARGCLTAYRAWRQQPGEGSIQTLSDAVHDLRKALARVEIDMSASRRDEQAIRPIPIPAHRASRRQ